MSEKTGVPKPSSSLKRALFIITAVIAAIFLIAVLFIYLQVRNPYSGEELTPTALPSTITLKDIVFEQKIHGGFGNSNSAAVSKKSPDQKYEVYIASRGLLCESEHTILIKHLADQTIAPIVTLTEADPCSGVSFETLWSQDNHFIEISGGAYEIGSFSYLYDVQKHLLYKVEF